MTARTQRAIFVGAAPMSFVVMAALAVAAKDNASVVARTDLAWHESLRAYAVKHPAWLSSWQVVTHLGDTVAVVLVDMVLVGLCLVGDRRRLAVVVASVAAAG